MKKRTPQEVIDHAIRENRFGEYLCYTLTASFALCGVVALLLGAFLRSELISLAGGLGSALFWPSLNYAMKIRRQNFAIRLIESALSTTASNAEAAQIVNAFFASEFVNPKK